MERNKQLTDGNIRRFPIIREIWLLVLLAYAGYSQAQNVTYLNDKAKTYQLRSMEIGKWEFHPGLYYVTLHRSYSGGYWRGLNIRWDERRSSVGKVEPVRASEVLLEAQSANNVQLQIDSIQPLMIEETVRSAERMADGMYFQYATQFGEAFNKIDELTSFINERSGGSLLEKALEIIEEKELLQEEISYIHETGPDKQMEQAKRQLAYEEVLTKLENLLNKSYKLAYYAQTLHNLNE